MNGWQRFGILIVCCVLVMVLFPNYDTAGWSFIGLAFLMWTGAIILLTFISNVFALYRFAWLNRLVTLAVLCAIVYTMLWYFPQTDKVSPINKLKYGEYPTKADIDKGLKRLTFNFDFANRNVRRNENFANQEEVQRSKEKVNKMSKATTPEQLIKVFQNTEEE
ncbi:MAG: hypothetical protein IKP96_01075 [Elusimicrobiaceae bacterium]|nr:hypothetical protein [Elusimicrobiaceae bacterium]